MLGDSQGNSTTGMTFLLYTGISALIIGDPCIDHLEIFPTSRKHRNILQLCTIDEAEWQGGWCEVEERVSSGEGGERLQLVGRWRRSRSTRSRRRDPELV